jgi:hypothetical protein
MMALWRGAHPALPAEQADRFQVAPRSAPLRSSEAALRPFRLGLLGSPKCIHLVKVVDVDT